MRSTRSNDQINLGTNRSDATVEINLGRKINLGTAAAGGPRRGAPWVFLAAILGVGGGVSGIPAALADVDGSADRLGIERFRGPFADRLQGAIETKLDDRYNLISGANLEQAARSRGVNLGQKSGFVEVGRLLQVRAFVSADVQKLAKQKSFVVQVRVHRGDTGDLVDRFVIADQDIGGLEAQMVRKVDRRIMASLALSEPGASEERGGTVRAQAPGMLVRAGGTSASSRRLAMRGRSRRADRATRGENNLGSAADLAASAAPAESLAVPSVELALGSRVFNRSFTHTENQSRVADYALKGAVAGTIDARVRPFNQRLPGLTPLGLFGSLEYGIGVNSRAAGSGERLATDVSSYSLGLAYRLGFLDESFALEPEVAYTRSRFSTGAEAASFNASYDTLAPRLAWRWDVAQRIALFGSAGYLHVLSKGTLTDAERFPRATMYGGEGSAGLSVAVGASFSLTASGGIRRFGIATNVVPGDLQIAGGAVDQTVWGGLGVTYRPGAR
jgi:hypothetical protein